MRMKHSLQTILAISIFGCLFSGYLSARELFAHAAPACAAVGPPGTILGYPPCVYGFFMFALLAATAAVGLWQPSTVRHIPIRSA